jgi:hypothetical protein
MNSLFALLSPLALLLPAVAAELPGSPAVSEEAAHAAPEREKPATGFDSVAAEPFRVLREARRPPLQNQVRIEERVIIRIAPSTQRAREQTMARLAREASDFREVKTDDCVPIGSIAAVYPSEQNRLLLFMRDRRVLSASLERACNAQDFYSGFYVERSDDGQLCSRRDRLQSRAGANCRMTQINRLVAERD